MSARVEPERALEVLLVSGVRVAVPIGFDEATLRRVLTVLEGSLGAAVVGANPRAHRAPGHAAQLRQAGRGG